MNPNEQNEINARRDRAKEILRKERRRSLIGEVLYLLGFSVEYTVVRFLRAARRAALALLHIFGRLFLMILRPFLLGLVTLCEDLTQPFVQFFSGLRHIWKLSEQMEEEDSAAIRKERRQYFRRGVKKYFVLVWNVFTYILPVCAAVAVFFYVRQGLAQRYVLDVRVDGQSVGYVESEQVFEIAREDVQSRINTAKTLLTDAGGTVADGQWDLIPTYVLVRRTDEMQTRSELEIANAILSLLGDSVVNGTAVYIDDELRFVIAEGDHLRSFLQGVKAPYEDKMDTTLRVDFMHDIRLVDGVFLKDSVSSYADVIEQLEDGSGILYYTAVEGDTVQSVVDTTGVAFDSLAALNPELLSLDQEIPEGTELITGVTSAELLKVKTVRKEIVLEDIPYDTQNGESEDYDFGEVVVEQEGQVGSQEVTYENTYIDGVLTDRAAVEINVIEEPVTEITVTGTKLKSGMVAKLGSGTFIWPVPQYKYVSRWMSSGHRGADICAAYGATIIASDSGTVTEAGYHYSWGNYVKIDHGNGYQTLYAHMSSIAVSAGQTVTQGQTIGYVGSTGNSTGNHCHFEMYKNGVLFSAYSLFAGM